MGGGRGSAARADRAPSPGRCGCGKPGRAFPGRPNAGEPRREGGTAVGLVRAWRAGARGVAGRSGSGSIHPKPAPLEGGRGRAGGGGRRRRRRRPLGGSGEGPRVRRPGGLWARGGHLGLAAGGCERRASARPGGGSPETARSGPLFRRGTLAPMRAKWCRCSRPWGCLGNLDSGSLSDGARAAAPTSSDSGSRRLPVTILGARSPRLVTGFRYLKNCNASSADCANANRLLLDFAFCLGIKTLDSRPAAGVTTNGVWAQRVWHVRCSTRGHQEVTGSQRPVIRRRPATPLRIVL